MALPALAYPILPGKTGAWRAMADEIRGPRFAAFAAIRERCGVRERTFLQQTPAGDLILITLEGEGEAIATFLAEEGAQDDSFTRWFAARVRELHGVDLAAAAPGPPPELVLDSRPG